MKHFLWWLISIQFIIAQNLPTYFNYTGQLMDGQNNLIMNTAKTIKASILSNQILYEETHNIVTDDMGVYEINIGSGNPLGNNYAVDIYDQTNLVLDISVYDDLSADYIPADTQPIISVPFALYAINTPPIITEGPIGAIGPGGPTGVQGITGPVGPTGAQGITGTFGIFGLTGPQGPQGITGATGAMGPPGNSFFPKIVADTTKLYCSKNVGIFLEDPAYEIDVAGNICSNGEYVNSDSLYKKDIELIDLSKINFGDIRAYEYQFKKRQYSERRFPAHRQYGFLAQEVEAILPELVHTSDAGNKSVNYIQLLPIILERAKANKQKMAELEAQVKESPMKKR